MAIEKKKMQDPTEAALSAIEQALNLEDGPATGDGSGGKVEPREPEPKLPDVDDHDFTNGPFRDLDVDSTPSQADTRPKSEEPSRPSFVAPDRTAVANDDRQNVGAMLQA